MPLPRSPHADGPPQDLDALVDPAEPARYTLPSKIRRGGPPVPYTEEMYLQVIQEAMEEGKSLEVTCARSHGLPTAPRVYAAQAKWPSVREAMHAYRTAMAYTHEGIVENAAALLMDPAQTGKLSTTQVRAIEAGIKSHQWLAESRNPAVFANKHAAMAAVQVIINSNALGDEGSLEPTSFHIEVKDPRGGKEQDNGRAEGA